MTHKARPRRSALYMPASNPRAIAKARSLPADVIILDLEDAVAPEAKEDARDAAIAAAAEGGFGSRELVIRINALDTSWGRDDLAAVAHANIDAVLVPKVYRPTDITACNAALADAPSRLQLWAMIETCAVVPHLDTLAALSAGTRLSLFVMGVNDLAKEYNAEGIIYEQIKFCDPWAYERMMGSHILHDEYHYPVLSIDRPYNVGASIGQLVFDGLNRPKPDAQLTHIPVRDTHRAGQVALRQVALAGALHQRSGQQAARAVAFVRVHPPAPGRGGKLNRFFAKGRSGVAGSGLGHGAGRRAVFREKQMKGIKETAGTMVAAATRSAVRAGGELFTAEAALATRQGPFGSKSRLQALPPVQNTT